MSSWPHEINADPVILDQPMYICVTQVFASLRLRVCVHVLEQIRTQQGFGEPDAISYPNTQTFFSEAKNSVRRLPLTLPF